MALARFIALARAPGGHSALPRAAARAAPPSYAALEVREAFVPMRDGTRLAANLFLPRGLKRGARLPLILEYLPYRKDDWSLARDYADYSYFVRRGYVAARLDIRGTGRSAGAPPDREYSEQEQRDAEDAIAWFASRPWSNGNVGMMGISWGGFNAIQMAMRRPAPPALKAILAVDATDELFHDDVHYIDGIMHADEYELAMDLQTAETRPPDFPLDERTLRNRFDAPPWFLLYLQHQRDGAFWQRASLAPDYARIKIPVFMVGGFYDGYRDSIPRMLERLNAPRHAIVGPWNHTFPHEAVPGPAIEWRATAVRWWDRYLKGKRNGIEREPQLSVYMRHWYPPGVDRVTIPGAWRSVSGWPPPDVASRTFYMTADHQLVDDAPVTTATNRLRYVPTAGNEAGFWWGELTPDQRPADALGLVYDSAALTGELAILGLPQVRLHAAATAPLADWIVRLSDVAPSGEVTLVTGAGIDGAQRESAARPAALTPNKMYAIDVPLHFTSWVFPPGHRIRIAVSNALWPMLWPTPFSMETSLEFGGAAPSRVVLPVVPARAPEIYFPNVTEKAAVPPGLGGSDEGFPGRYTIERDVLHQATRIDWSGAGTQYFPWGEEATKEAIVYRQADCCSARSSVHGDASTAVKLRDRTLTWRVHLDVSSDARYFYYRFERELLRAGVVIRRRRWASTIRRDFQ